MFIHKTQCLLIKTVLSTSPWNWICQNVLWLCHVDKCFWFLRMTWALKLYLITRIYNSIISSVPLYHLESLIVPVFLILSCCNFYVMSHSTFHDQIRHLIACLNMRIMYLINDNEIYDILFIMITTSFYWSKISKTKTK